MSERIRGGYDDALYKSTFTYLFDMLRNRPVRNCRSPSIWQQGGGGVKPTPRNTKNYISDLLSTAAQWAQLNP